MHAHVHRAYPYGWLPRFGYAIALHTRTIKSSKSREIAPRRACPLHSTAYPSQSYRSPIHFFIPSSKYARGKSNFRIGEKRKFARQLYLLVRSYRSDPFLSSSNSILIKIYFFWNIQILWRKYYFRRLWKYFKSKVNWFRYYKTRTGRDLSLNFLLNYVLILDEAFNS